MFRAALLLLLSFSVTALEGSQALRALQSDREAEVERIQHAEITQLQLALRRRLPSNRRADLYFRMAEIYLELYRATFLLEGRLHDQKIAKGEKVGTISREFSQPYLRRGIEACLAILKLRIPFDKMDRVLYFMAFNTGELGDEEESNRYYREIIRKFPQSPYAVEAYREIGTRAYLRKDYRSASKAFEAALKVGADSPVIPEILHKLAWSYYRQKRFSEAVATMKRAIQVSQKTGGRYLSLKDEALKDLSVFLVELGRVDEAVAYFKSVAGDKDYLPIVLEQLGREFERTVKLQQAIQVYEVLYRMSPKSEAGFRTFAKLVELDIKRKAYTSALKRLSAYGDIPRLKEEESKQVLVSLKALVRRTATQSHEQFRKHGNRKALSQADQFYTAYLNSFSAKDEDTTEMRMYLAEVKRETGRFADAATLYESVVRVGESKYQRQAVTLWMSVLSQQLKRVAGQKQKVKLKEPSKLEYEYIRAADAFRVEMGRTVQAREAFLETAQILAGYPATRARAIERIGLLLDQDPATAEALKAARLWLQILEDALPDPERAGIEKYRARATTLREAVIALKKNGPLLRYDRERGASKLDAELTDWTRKLRIGEVAILEREKEYGDAAEAYLKLALEASDRSTAEKAFGSALKAFSKEGDEKKLAETIAEWSRRYPKSAELDRVSKAVATESFVQGDFEQAVYVFSLLGQEEGGAASLATAAELSYGVGDFKKARTFLKTYLERYPSHSERWAIALRWGEISEESDAWDEALEAYRFCSNGPSEFELECRVRQALLLEKKGEEASGKALLSQVASRNLKAQEKDSPYRGYARYLEAYRFEQSKTFLPLALPESVLNERVEERIRFFEILNKSYLAVVDAGGPWAVAALTRLAAWTDRFAEELKRVEPPSGFKPEEVTAFRKTLNDIADPLRAQAVAALQKAIKTANDVGLLSPTLIDAQDRLADLGVQGVYRSQGARGGFRLAGASPKPEKPEAALSALRARLKQDLKSTELWIDYGNLLWGDSKPGLARVAYQRALELSSRNAAALNNLGVIELHASALEDWVIVGRAQSFIEHALSADSGFAVAELNAALLYSYYRLFERALPFWRRVNQKGALSIVREGLGAALFGTGQTSQGVATLGGLKDSGFVAFYVFASQAERSQDWKSCIKSLKKIDRSEREGFLERSYDHLLRRCENGGRS